MQSKQSIKFIECPRDAMQGWEKNIPTPIKAEYINALLRVGFDTIDFGSFVSPKAIPQMADTKEVLKLLTKSSSATKLLAIVANQRGAMDACDYELIDYVGFPFSISETFQQRNTNKSIKDSFIELEAIQNLCLKNHKDLVVYISMGFGNPYGDLYHEEIVLEWVNKVAELGVSIISLADTVGVATPDQIGAVTEKVVLNFSDIEVGVHLHATPELWQHKIDAAIRAGCARIDGAMRGIGGCPMSGNDLVGNMNSELVVSYLNKNNLLSQPINENAFNLCVELAAKIFG